VRKVFPEIGKNLLEHLNEITPITIIMICTYNKALMLIAPNNYEEERESYL